MLPFVQFHSQETLEQSILPQYVCQIVDPYVQILMKGLAEFLIHLHRGHPSVSNIVGNLSVAWHGMQHFVDDKSIESC